MKRLLPFSALFVLLFTTHVCGATRFEDEGRMKWGIVIKPHVSGVRLSILPLTLDQMIFAPSVEFFDEIKLSSGVGLRFSASYALRGGKVCAKGDENVVSTVTSLIQNDTVPTFSDMKGSLHTREIEFALAPRFYLGEDQKLSISVGPVLNYTSAAKVKLSFKDSGQNEESFDMDLLDQASEASLKIPRFGWGIVMGIDYEFDSGVALGCAYNVGLSNSLPRGLRPFSARKVSGGFTLGYNFARLLR